MVESRRRRRSTDSPGLGDRRAVTPAVAKSLELGMVVLFVGLLVTVLVGGIVPEYRRAADARIGDRVLASASGEIERAVPPAVDAVDVATRHRVALPDRIGGKAYAVRADGRHLVLDHPDPRVSGRVALVLPDRVDRVEGRWESDVPAVVVVRSEADGLAVELAEGGDG